MKSNTGRKAWWIAGGVAALFALSFIADPTAFIERVRAGSESSTTAGTNGTRESVAPQATRTTTANPAPAPTSSETATATDVCTEITTSQGAWEFLKTHISSNWHSQHSFLWMSYEEKQAYANDAAISAGCDPARPNYLLGVLSSYASGHLDDGEEIPESVPETCTLPQRAAYGDDFSAYLEAFTAAVTPLAAEYVQALAARGVEITRDGTDEVELAYAFLGAMGCPAHWWVESPTSSAMLEAIAGLDPYEPLVPNEGGMPGTWDGSVPNVDIDNPFWCGWSFRGGFNCGVH